jgi:uncharacterized protein YuzE
MKITYDASSDAAYIEFDNEMNEPSEHDHTDGEWPINVDVDKGGRVTGIEIMNASTIIAHEILEGKRRP